MIPRQSRAALPAAAAAAAAVLSLCLLLGASTAAAQSNPSSLSSSSTGLQEWTPTVDANHTGWGWNGSCPAVGE